MKTMLAFLFLVSGTAFAENDLSQFKTIKKDVLIYSAKVQDSDSTVIQFRVPHDYTNTLNCSIHAEVSYINAEGTMGKKLVKSIGTAVFPEKAFPGELDYPLSVDLKEGEKIEPGMYLKITNGASCTGWSARTPLSTETCTLLNPQPQEICTLLAPGQKLYPLMSNEQYLGSCSCP